MVVVRHDDVAGANPAAGDKWNIAVHHPNAAIAAGRLAAVVVAAEAAAAVDADVDTAEAVEAAVAAVAVVDDREPPGDSNNAVEDQDAGRMPALVDDDVGDAVVAKIPYAAAAAAEKKAVPWVAVVVAVAVYTAAWTDLAVVQNMRTVIVAREVLPRIARLDLDPPRVAVLEPSRRHSFFNNKKNIEIKVIETKVMDPNVSNQQSQMIGTLDTIRTLEKEYFVITAYLFIAPSSRSDALSQGRILGRQIA